MTTPLIGVTTYRNMNAFGFPQFSLSENYIDSLARAGAIPLMIPLGLSSQALDALLPRLDGVLFSGGGDMHPASYGSQMHPLVDDVDEDRDRLELHLLKQTIERRTPFLGICRGFQVINVGLGGALYEDILDQHPGAIKHKYYPDWPRDHLAHDVQLEADSRLTEILGGTQFPVNSLHHQGVRALAPGLRPAAYAPDGVLEGFELPDYPFGLAVQWHPEWLQEHAPMRALIQAFVQACAQGGK